MCDFCGDINKQIGIFINRNDHPIFKIKELKIELQVQILEIQIIEKAIDAFLIRNYKKFDALVGDCKCQDRVSMLLDIIQENSLDKKSLSRIQIELAQLKEKLLIFVDKIEHFHMNDIKKLITEIYGMNIYDYFIKNDLDYKPIKELNLLGLSFFTYLKFNEIVHLSNNSVSNSKAKELLLLSKHHLSLFSVIYEQNLAIKYGNLEIQKILEYVNKENFISMTAFFPSVKIVLEKIKYKYQIILKKIVFFCKCGNLKNIELSFFKFNSDNSFEKIIINNIDEVLFVVEGYAFNGSFEALSNKAHITLRTSIFSLNDFKTCLCDKSLNIPDMDNIEKVILSNAAHHKQFTNGVEIPWADLGLENSELKKEYDYLRTLPGYSLDDMSKFCIRHIYASTVEQELEDQRQLLAKLGKK